VTVTRSGFQDLVERLNTIPSLPEVATQVSKLVEDPRTNAGRIGDLVLKDTGMAARVLRLVNSVYYALPEPVSDLDQAINVLGFKTIRAIALSLSVLSAFQQQNANFNMKAFWTHCAVSAALCQQIAAVARIGDPEVAFIIGLLRYVGRLVMAENTPGETRAVIAVAREYRFPFHRAAREVLATDDAEVGAWLAGKWGLEPPIVEALRWQYDPAQAGDKRMVAMLTFTEYVCALKNLRASGDFDRPAVDPASFQALGLDKAALMEVLSAVDAEVERARQLLKVGLS
jgi:HD-like signal output (HDOD) protein